MSEWGMPNISLPELQALSGFVAEMVRLAQNIKKTAPQCKEDCERLERQGQAAGRILEKIH